MTIDIEKIIEFVSSVYGNNTKLTEMTLLEMGIDINNPKNDWGILGKCTICGEEWINCSCLVRK
jgi:hypothetical protein